MGCSRQYGNGLCNDQKAIEHDQEALIRLVDVQAGLHLCCWHAKIIRFLVMMPIYMYEFSLSLHFQLYSWTRYLVLPPNLQLRPYVMCANIKYPDKNA